MSVRAAAVALFLIAGFVIIGVTLAGPLTTVADSINDTGDYSDVGGNDGNAIITGLVDAWFNIVLIVIFGTMAWAAWFVYRREATRGQL